MWYSQHSMVVVHSDIQEVYGRIVAARVVNFTSVQCGAIVHLLLPDPEHLSAVDKSAFTDILSEAAWSHI